jgi:hypothetical protein
MLQGGVSLNSAMYVLLNYFLGFELPDISERRPIIASTVNNIPDSSRRHQNDVTIETETFGREMFASSRRLQNESDNDQTNNSRRLLIERNINVAGTTVSIDDQNSHTKELSHLKVKIRLNRNAG